MDPEGIYPQGQQIGYGLYAIAGQNNFDPSKSNHERVVEQGFTLAGPYYDYDWQGLEYVHQAAEAGLKFTYQLRSHESLQGIPLEQRTSAIAALSDAQIAGVAREQVEAVLDDPVANATVARWATMPEEIRYWVAEDLRHQQITIDTIRQIEIERGALSRPIWSYQANHRTANQLVITGGDLDIITKGSYLTTRDDRGPQRAGRAIWNYDQILTAAETLDATPQVIFQLYEDFTDPQTGTDATEIERVLRHDVYLALVKGVTSLNVFSMFENRPNLTTHNEQFEAYGSVATDLTGPLNLQEVFLSGEHRDDLTIRPTDAPKTFAYTDIYDGSHVYPTLHWLSVAEGDARYVVLVNSTESPMTVEIDGLPSQYVVADLFEGSSQNATSAMHAVSLDVLGVKALRFTAG